MGQFSIRGSGQSAGKGMVTDLRLVNSDSCKSLCVKAFVFSHTTISFRSAGHQRHLSAAKFPDSFYPAADRAFIFECSKIT